MAKKKITMSRTVDSSQAEQLAAAGRARGYTVKVSGATKKRKKKKSNNDPYGFGNMTPDYKF